jgi:hypothetical protein
MWFARLERDPQRLARTEEMRLPYDIIEVARAQAVGERCVGLSLLEEVKARR